MRIREPKTTALIFASGKMVVTGAKSEDDSRLASRKYARIIQKLGFDAKFAEFKIQNIVGSCDVRFPIRLEGLAFSHGAFSSYEPEVSISNQNATPSSTVHLYSYLRGQEIANYCEEVVALTHSALQLFPGLIYRMMKPKVVLLIFVSGKIVLTGAKVREEIYMAFNQIYSVLVGECACVADKGEWAQRGCRVPEGSLGGPELAAWRVACRVRGRSKKRRNGKCGVSRACRARKVHVGRRYESSIISRARRGNSRGPNSKLGQEWRAEGVLETGGTSSGPSSPRTPRSSHDFAVMTLLHSCLVGFLAGPRLSHLSHIFSLDHQLIDSISFISPSPQTEECISQVYMVVLLD